MSEIGHNSDGALDGSQLRTIAERIVRLEKEKKETADDIREVYSEAKANGYDVKVLRKAIALAQRDPNVRAEEEAVLDLYLASLGMLD